MAYGNRYNPYTQTHLNQLGQENTYQPVYDPSETARYADLLTRRQQRFDATRQNLAQFQGQVAGQQTFAPDILEGQLGNFNEKVQDVVNNQYGGDYGLAANDIVDMISQERANPVYKLIQYQNQQAQQFEAARAKDPARFIELQDPRSREALESAILAQQEGGDPYSMLQGQFTKRDDYIGNVNKQFNKFVPDISESVYKDVQGIQGLKKDTQVKRITEDRINRVVERGVDSWLQINPSFAIENPEDTRNQAKEFIKGSLYDEVFSQVNARVYGDPLLDGKTNKSIRGSGTIELPNVGEQSKALNSDIEELEALIDTPEPEDKFIERVIEERLTPGERKRREEAGESIVKVEAQGETPEYRKYREASEKFQKVYDEDVKGTKEKPGFESRVNMSKYPGWTQKSNKQKALSYMKTKKNMSNVTEDVKAIGYGARPDIDKLVTQQQLRIAKSLNIDGEEVGLDRFKKSLGAKRTDMSDIVDKMSIIGTDNYGRFVARYDEDTNKGIKTHIVRFYPNKESLNAFAPIKDVLDRYNVKDAKPMSIEDSDGSIWFVDYAYDGEKLVPRIAIDQFGRNKDLKGEQISQFLDANPQAITSLDNIVEDRYDIYNQFYENYTGD